MLPIEPCNEIYFPCFHFISSRYAVRRIGFFFCLLRNESFLVKFFFIFFCVPRFIVHFFFFFFRQFSLENESGLLVLLTDWGLKNCGYSNIWIINYPKKQLVEIIIFIIDFFLFVESESFLVIFEVSCFSLYRFFLGNFLSKMDYWYIDKVWGLKNRGYRDASDKNYPESFSIIFNASRLYF